MKILSAHHIEQNVKKKKNTAGSWIQAEHILQLCVIHMLQAIDFILYLYCLNAE